MRLIPRRLALQSFLSAAATLVGPSERAHAWCGERFPSWAYYLQWDQQEVPFEWRGIKSSVSYRIVGDEVREQKSAVPPVLVLGTPGLGYEYLENLEAITLTDRRVIEVTFAGTGGGSSVPKPLRSPDAWAEQCRVVCRKLNIRTAHVVAHGLGALPALALASQGAEGTPRVRSLVLVSPFGSTSDLRPEYRAAVLGAADGKSQSSLLLPTASANARDSCIAESRAAARSDLVFGAANSADALEGVPLGGTALGERIGAAEAAGVAVLLANGGKSDLVDASGWEGLPASVRRMAFTASGHLPFIEEREEFLTALFDYFDGVDGVETNRELKFADPMATLKGMR